jgi:predicted nucleic acid-binding protein
MRLHHYLNGGTLSPFPAEPEQLPVTEAIAERWGYLAAAAKQEGMTLAVVDGLIAATAIHHDLTIVTRRAKDLAV